jgi:hypothetical protein
MKITHYHEKNDIEIYCICISMSEDILQRLEKQLLSAGPKDILWKYKCDTIYRKHTQYVPQVKERPNEVADKPVAVHVNEVADKPVVVHVNEVADKPVAVHVNEVVNRPVRRTVKHVKSVSVKPLDIILQETNTFPQAIDKVKDKLIEVLSMQEYIKVFGAKKSAEMMTGVVNNKWNKSTALFLSFLFDKTVVYNQENILYNKDKNNGSILI